MRELALALMLGASVFQPVLKIEPTPLGDAFTFKATDAYGLDSNIATVTVATTVVGPKDGRLIATDIDGDALTYSIVTQGAKGTALITNTQTGEFIYTPHPSVTLTLSGRDPNKPYILQRSLDLRSWSDHGVFLPGMESISDKSSASQQFYRAVQSLPAPPIAARARTRVVPTP